MILSGTVLGLICVIALLAASFLLAWLDHKERGKGNVEKSRSLSRMALVLFLVAFFGGVAVTLVGGVRPRDDGQTMTGKNTGSSNTPMVAIGQVDPEELRALEEKVANDPRDVKSRERLGHLYLQRWDFENVFRMAHEALQSNPKSVESRVHMGMVFAAMGKKEEALDQMNQALSLDPKNTEAQRFKIMIESMPATNR